MNTSMQIYRWEPNLYFGNYVWLSRYSTEIVGRSLVGRDSSQPFGSTEPDEG